MMSCYYNRKLMEALQLVVRRVYEA